jgi:thiosulfate reductase cytochrome b subunit
MFRVGSKTPITGLLLFGCSEYLKIYCAVCSNLKCYLSGNRLFFGSVCTGIIMLPQISMDSYILCSVKFHLYWHEFFFFPLMTNELVFGCFSLWQEVGAILSISHCMPLRNKPPRWRLLVERCWV